MKWYLILIYLVFWEKRTFLANSRAPCISVFRSIGPIGINISLNNCFSYRASLTAGVKAIYSALIVVVATVFYLVLAQLIIPPNRVNTIPEVVWRGSWEHNIYNRTRVLRTPYCVGRREGEEDRAIYTARCYSRACDQPREHPLFPHYSRFTVL
jgi:hypothetical protein